ncbi:MAG: peptidylprolyl isomerase [Verrucomicrobiota bacterium]
MSDSEEVAVLDTLHGKIVLEFWPDVAPKHVENFIKLSKEGFYNETAFHRIVKGFMIQGGCPHTKEGATGMPGTGDPGYKIDAEFNNKPHVRGVLSAARAADPNSAGCQFFICLEDAPFLNNQYTAFGKLIQGDEVLTLLGNMETKMGSGGEKSTPTTRASVNSVTIVTKDSI